MTKILRTPQAQLDLVEIWVYIAQDSVKAADNVLTTIDRQIKLIAGSPKIGRQRKELAPELRSFPTSNYVVFYRSKQKHIEIIRVLHQSRDIKNIGGLSEV